MLAWGYWLLATRVGQESCEQAVGLLGEAGSSCHLLPLLQPLSSWFPTQWVSPHLWGPDWDTASDGLLSLLLCLQSGHGHSWGGSPCRVV